MGMLFLPCVEESLPPLTSSLFQEIFYVSLHQRIKIDASQHVSHSCTLQLRASLLGDMAESLERAEHPFPVMGATLGSPQPPPAARGLVFTEEDMPSRQPLHVGYAEQVIFAYLLTTRRRAGDAFITEEWCAVSPEGSLVQHAEAQGWLSSL